ncbi:MAG: DnaD domain protein, partial [Oscillospiraceae bacterium]
CAEIDRRGMAYAKNVADTWVNDGIDDQNVDAHMDKLLYLRSLEGRLKKSMGLNRSFIAAEKKYIARWADFGFDCNMITLAYEANVTAIGKVNFKYMDKILTDWNQKGYKTPEDTKKKFDSKPAENKNPNGKITIDGKKESFKPKEESEFMRLLMENYDKE